MTPAVEPVVLEPDLSAEAIVADILPLARRLLAQLDKGRGARRLSTVLAALRGFEHLAAIAGLEIGAAAFRTACEVDDEK